MSNGNGSKAFMNATMQTQIYTLSSCILGHATYSKIYKKKKKIVNATVISTSDITT